MSKLKKIDKALSADKRGVTQQLEEELIQLLSYLRKAPKVIQAILLSRIQNIIYSFAYNDVIKQLYLDVKSHNPPNK